MAIDDRRLDLIADARVAAEVCEDLSESVYLTVVFLDRGHSGQIRLLFFSFLCCSFFPFSLVRLHGETLVIDDDFLAGSPCVRPWC